MQDIRDSTTLLPGGYINLTDSQSPGFLHRFHVLNGSNLVRGVDSDSRTAFLSIWVQSMEIPTDSLLVICQFDDSGLDHVGVYQSNSVDWKISAVEKAGGPMDIDDVQDLLLDRYMRLDDSQKMDTCCDRYCTVLKIWSMEGQTKRCCRWTGHVTNNYVAPVFVLVILSVLYVIGMGMNP